TVAITTATSYSYSGLSKDSVYWFTVMPRINGKGGRRAAAISRQPNSGSCAGAISDNDLAMDAILAPASGRMFTSTQLTATTTISVRIKNLDDATVNNFDMKYSINGGAFITENVATTVNAGATYIHNFTTTADLSAIGNYDLVVVVKNTNPDAVSVNDTLFYRVKQLPNAALDLTSAFLDQMEGAGDDLYERDTIGLTGIDRYDFSRSTLYGRLRTFVNTGMAYSGSNALTIDANRYHPAGNTNYLTGTFNLVSYNVAVDDIRLDFQFNNHGQFPHANNKVWIRGNDLQPWIEVYDLDDEQADPGFYKRSQSIEIADVLAANGQAFGTSFQVRWGQWGQIAATEPAYAGGYSFDDIRLYEVFNDLQMISIDTPVTASCGLTNAQPVRITVKNSSNAVVNNVPVRYRVNSGAWTTENIASIPANTEVQYTFTGTADFSAPGNYLIEAQVNFPGDSFNENDTISTTIVNSPVITSFPYLEGFESGNGSWHTGGRNSSWEYGTPASNKINSAANGAKAWKTRLAGHYNDNEYSFLYSPCFDISGMTNPSLSFSMAHDLEDCGNDFCDGAWVEYSEDGVNWTKLGTQGQGTNWYNKAADQLWSQQNFTRWHAATIALPVGANRLRLRFVVFTDGAVNREGVAIDDIHIYDNTNGIYDGVTMGAPVTQTVSGNSWIDFTSGGKLVASIHPNNQTMGATDVQAYVNTAAVRFTTSQYYHDRNITIKPANTLLGDSVTVRFYFLETETDTLIKATGCNTCDKPSSAYELGVSKYSDPMDNFENGSIGDDIQGTWDFILPANVRKVPFDKGYYAEFKVMEFSEFWLNNGWFTGTSPLPVKLLDFTTQRNGEDVQVRWKTSSEVDVDRFEVEVARGNEALQNNSFSKIGEVASQGNSTSTLQYLFTDIESGKSGTRYYRLKVINLDGSFFYSQIRSVVFDDVRLWQVFPNPSPGRFSLAFQLNQDDVLNARVLDAKGSLVKNYRRTGDGFLQKLEIDLGMVANGVYLLQVEAAGKTYQFKLFKH
ncbi:MAG: T9SS type A sorting domain-containing protein, partial [Flavisolibacter sp.]